MSPTTRSQFPAVLAYRDTLHERLGRVFLQTLKHELAESAEMAVTDWKFEMLANPALRRIAAMEAVDASLLVISTDSDDPLPKGVKDVVAAFSTGSRSTSVLVVLLVETPGRSAASWPDHLCVQDMLKEGGRRLMIYVSERDVEESGQFSSADLRRVDSGCPIAIGDYPELFC